MENFCKGLFFGMALGVVAGAVVVAKNKSLSSMVKQKANIVEKKMTDVTEKIKDKIDECAKEGKDAEISKTGGEKSSQENCDCNSNSSNQPCNCN